MLFRSALVSFTPFRIGLAVAFLGLMTTLGAGHGGFVGNLLGGGSRRCSAAPARCSSASPRFSRAGSCSRAPPYGALLRRSGHAVRRAHGAARRSLERAGPPGGRREHRRPRAAHEPPIDVVHDYPDVVSEGLSEPSPLLARPGRRRPTSRRRSSTSPRPEGGVRAAGPRRPDDVAAVGEGRRRRRPAHRRHARPDARALRRRGDDRRPDRRPARDALRAPARARHEGVEGRGAEGRSLLRARDDRDPDSGADSRQAGRRRRGSEPEPEDRHARRHLRRPALDREPARRLARQGHLRQRRSGPTSRGCRTS